MVSLLSISTLCPSDELLTTVTITTKCIDTPTDPHIQKKKCQGSTIEG